MCYDTASRPCQLSPDLTVNNALARARVVVCMCALFSSDCCYVCEGSQTRPGTCVGVSGVRTALSQSARSSTRKLWFGTCVVAATKELKGQRTKRGRSC